MIITVEATNTTNDSFVIGSIPILLLRPFLPPTVPLVCFVDFQPIGDRTVRAIDSLRDENSPRIGHERQKPSLQMASSPVLPAGRTAFLDYERDRGKIDLSFRVSARIGRTGIVTGFEHIEQRQ